MAKILIVDDSAFTRARLKMMCESGGHEVVGLAQDGEEGLKLFKSLKPEVVTLDYLMADKDGEQVLKEILQHDPGARVIMISGSGDHTVEERTLQLGAKLFMEKPMKQRDVLKVIDQVMGI